MSETIYLSNEIYKMKILPNFGNPDNLENNNLNVSKIVDTLDQVGNDQDILDSFNKLTPKSNKVGDKLEWLKQNKSFRGYLLIGLGILFGGMTSPSPRGNLISDLINHHENQHQGHYRILMCGPETTIKIEGSAVAEASVKKPEAEAKKTERKSPRRKYRKHNTKIHGLKDLPPKEMSLKEKLGDKLYDELLKDNSKSFGSHQPQPRIILLPPGPFR